MVQSSVSGMFTDERSQVHNQVGALLLAAQTNAHDLQLLLVAVHNTVHHVGDVGTGQAVQVRAWGSSLGRVTRTSLPSTLTVIRDDSWNSGCLGALDGDVMCCLIDSDSNAGRNDDGFSSNSRHCLLPLSYHTVGQGLRRDVCSTCSLISHDALRGGNDCGAQALHDLGHILAVGVDAQAGLGHAAQTSDNGLAVS